MKLNRRAALAGVADLSAAPQAFAQAFPSKPTKIVVPFAAGSATDLAARGLGTTGPKRRSVAAHPPAIAETVPGYSLVNWLAVFAPAATPKSIQEAGIAPQ